MELWTYSLVVNFWKFIIQIFQLCVELNTLYLYSSMIFPKHQLQIRRLQLIMKYKTYLVLEYIPNLILYSSQNRMNFTIGKLVYSAELIPLWLLISLERTETCAWEKHFLPQFLLQNSTLWNSTKKNSKVVSYIQDNASWERIYIPLKSILPCLSSLGLADSKNQVRTRFSTIPELQRYPQ